MTGLGFRGAAAGVLFHRKRLPAVGFKRTDLISSGQKRERWATFPAQAQVAAWARGAQSMPRWATARAGPRLALKPPRPHSNGPTRPV
jgi:hypothetical protein